MKKALIPLAAAVLLLSGCGGGEESTIAQDDLPYGATLAVDTKSYAVPVQYDSRKVPAALLQQVARYYDAIETENAEEFAAVQLPVFREYRLKTLQGQYTEEDILGNTHDAVIQTFGEEFEYALIDITGFEEDPQTAEGAKLSATLDGIAEEMEESKPSDVTDLYVKMTISRYLTAKDSGVTGETNDVIADEILYAVKQGEDWFLIYSG